MSNQSEEENRRCIYCGNEGKSGDPVNHVGGKFREGSNKLHPVEVLITQALSLNLNQLVSDLRNKKEVGQKVFIHLSCRTVLKNGSRPKRKQQEEKTVTVKRVVRRSEVEEFDFMQQCFLCGNICQTDDKHPGRETQFCTVTSNDSQLYASILDLAKKNDKDAKNIERRLMSVSNLVAVSAKYHKN